MLAPTECEAVQAVFASPMRQSGGILGEPVRNRGESLESVDQLGVSLVEYAVDDGGEVVDLVVSQRHLRSVW
ncbi:MAG TPA: hypothetical protein VES20_05775 [Bryobacteraceae bacterium]|nr:hypothetical protein [Bryobacteraceae bacterium]